MHLFSKPSHKQRNHPISSVPAQTILCILVKTNCYSNSPLRAIVTGHGVPQRRNSLKSGHFLVNQVHHSAPEHEAGEHRKQTRKTCTEFTESEPVYASLCTILLQCLHRKHIKIKIVRESGEVLQ